MNSTWAEVENLVNLNLEANPSAYILILGDFNTRLGPNNSVLAKHINLEFDESSPPWLNRPRSSRDKIITPHATLLINLCLNLHIAILNGTWGKDIPGEYTHLSIRGPSVIDYAIASPALFPFLSDFSVGVRADSDHLPLLLSLTFPSSPSSPQIPPSQPSCRLIWTSQTEADFFSWTLLPEISNLNLTIATTDSIATAITSYNTLVDSLITSLSSPTNSPSHNRATSWFDSDCWQAKKHVRSLFHSFHLNPTPASLQHYLTVRRSCTLLLDSKKHFFAQRKWSDLLQAILTHNYKAFWSLVSSSTTFSSSDPSSSIPSEEWIAHFSTIFFSPNPNPPSDPSLQALPDWPPVTSEEILDLISSLKSGKAPGPDQVLTEILTSNPHWWSHSLANFFTLVNHSGTLPNSWLISTLIPIFKKGDPSLPSNYRPISLLSFIGKLYSKSLLAKLSAWASSINLPGKEQIGFRSGASTLDHALLLSHLVEKYSIHHKSSLFAAFVDLQGAFDSVNRSLLWDKLSQWGIDPRLLFLLRRLHSSNTCQIRLPNSNTLTDRFQVNRGVRQGCILAPLLFNLFLADLPPFLCKATNSSPSLNGAPLSVLLYADDAVLLSLSKAGLRLLLAKFQDYCSINDLSINSSKTKIVVFSKSSPLSTWTVGTQSYQQVPTFKYLGLTFHFKLNWAPHKKSVISTSTSQLNAISKFHYFSGNQFVPAALHIFQCKLLSHLFYGVPIWIEAVNHDIDSIAAVFFRKILGVPNMIRLSTMVLELGTHLPSTLAWVSTFKYWLRIHLHSNSNSLLFDLLSDSYTSNWFKLIDSKLLSLGLNLESLFDLGLQQAHSLIKHKLLQLEFESLSADLNPTCSPLFFSLPPSLGRPSNYFSSLTNPGQRRAFMLARLNIFPSAVHAGRFAKIPRANRLCFFCHTLPDSLDHILFHCPVHSSLRKLFLEPWLSLLPNSLTFFLNDSCPPITSAVARYLLEISNLTHYL